MRLLPDQGHPLVGRAYDRHNRLLRALLLGDIHTENVLLGRAIAMGRALGVERFLSVGDIVDGPGDPLACVAQLREAGFEVVRGNHERWVLDGRRLDPFDYPEDTLAWLRTLPRTREYETPTGRVLLGHGLGEDDMSRLKPETQGYALECLDALWALQRAGRHRWLLGGHTHRAMVRTIDGLTVVNAGTLVHDEEPGFMVCDFASGRIERWALLPVVQQVEAWQVT